MVFGAFFQPGSCHSFPHTAFFYKSLLQLSKLFIEQVTGHSNQADDNIGGDGGIGMLDSFPESS